MIRHSLLYPFFNLLAERLLVFCTCGNRQLLRHDISPGELGRLLLDVYANDGAVCHFWVRKKERFELCRGNLEAFVLYQLVYRQRC